MAEPRPSIVLIGGGGHCRSCIDVIEASGRFQIAGIVDSDTARRGDEVLGYAVIGTDDDLPAIQRGCNHALITVGQIESAAVRVALHARLLELGFDLPLIVSPTASVSRHATIGDGTIVMHQVIVNAGAAVGTNCILNTKALIEHDARVGDHCHVSTGAIVNGAVHIGDRCFIGSNATVANNVCLPDDHFVRAGLLVRSQRDGRPMQHA